MLAIIVSYVVENNTWEGSSERLNEFWEYLSKKSLIRPDSWFYNLVGLFT